MVFHCFISSQTTRTTGRDVDLAGTDLKTVITVIRRSSRGGQKRIAIAVR